MLIICAALLVIWLLGVIAVCTFCIAAARADRLTSQTLSPNEDLGDLFPVLLNATSKRRPAA
jgi:beta-lactamase regulating signal transducer with metallopeptidase domain